MATTTNYGWTTPDDTALVKDGAAAIRSLGTAVDSSVKNLNPGTTAGDIDYYSNSTTKTRLAIGSTGQVLTVAGGVPSWSAPSGFEPQLTPKTTGNYILPGLTSASTSNNATANLCNYYPIWLPSGTYDRISCSTGASNTGTSTIFRLGIYNQTNGKPSTVLLDAGTITTGASVSNTTYEITISQTISAGFYYLAIAQQNAGTGLMVNWNFTTDVPTPNVAQTVTAPRQNIIKYFTQTGVTGAFATAGTLTGVNNASGAPIVFLRMV